MKVQPYPVLLNRNCRIDHFFQNGQYRILTANQLAKPLLGLCNMSYSPYFTITFSDGTFWEKQYNQS